MTKNSLDFPLAMQTRLKPINGELYCFAISLIVKHRVYVHISMNTYYVKACHLRTCASKATNSQVLIRVLREKQEIEFIQCNGGQSHAGKQTDHFSPISNHVLFMRANLVWTMFHWYSVHLLCADCLGTEAILFYALIYLFISTLKICMAWKGTVTSQWGHKVKHRARLQAV